MNPTSGCPECGAAIAADDEVRGVGGSCVTEHGSAALRARGGVNQPETESWKKAQYECPVHGYFVRHAPFPVSQQPPSQVGCPVPLMLFRDAPPSRCGRISQSVPADRVEAVVPAPPAVTAEVYAMRDALLLEAVVDQPAPAQVNVTVEQWDAVSLPLEPQRFVNWTLYDRRCAVDDPLDPLDVVIDGVSTLRYLLWADEQTRREQSRAHFTPAMRAAVSAHWSAELRDRIANKAPRKPTLSEEREAAGPRIMVDLEEP